MRGKSKCKILKEIRQKIAKENDIPLVTKECTYQGECSGTCPRCESELRYLEQQLARRQQLGKTVTVAALSLSLVAGSTGCTLLSPEVKGEVPYEGEPTEIVELAGDVPWTETDGVPTEDVGCTTDPLSETLREKTGVISTEELLIGEVAETQESTTDLVLTGDVAYPEESVDGNG
ncbi:MAG: hypothetical protein IKT58_02460 [Oscillospiraceae bacterium]|nr:hypothetical protein [Oscillospiraceae bacterium]